MYGDMYMYLPPTIGQLPAAYASYIQQLQWNLCYM